MYSYKHVLYYYFKQILRFHWLISANITSEYFHSYSQNPLFAYICSLNKNEIFGFICKITWRFKHFYMLLLLVVKY